MTIYQIVETLNFGDAIGNDIVAIKHVIEEMGLETAIYANYVSPKVKEPGAFRIANMPKLSEDDIVIYHMANGSELNTMVPELNCRKIMIYHNITPPEFFNIDNIAESQGCRKGLDDMEKIRGTFTSYIADSEFNKNDMIEMGYKANEIEVIPVIVPFDDYEQTPDQTMVSELSDGMTNIVFVGRIAPNKKHEDIIRTFAYYKKHINPNSRLILAGSANTQGMYYGDLLSYIKELGVQDVVFPGHISFAEILAIYKTADVFLCLSEHEGFCVPLLEAMTFDVPVIAYEAGAVPETMGGSGIVVDDKNPVFLSRVINEVVNNQEMREAIIAAQRERLKHFQYDKIKHQLQDYIRRFMEKFPPLSPDDPEKSYRDLYSIVEQNMNDAGKTMQFSQDALLQSARRTAGEADVTELLNANYPTRSFIEAAYISFFNQLPDKLGYEHWEQEAKVCGRKEFLKRLISSAVESDLRKNKGIRVKYNPFTMATLRRVHPSDDVETSVDEVEEGGMVTA
jgi:glycosyltransferase involved in cell wall biosynthesis